MRYEARRHRRASTLHRNPSYVQAMPGAGICCDCSRAARTTGRAAGQSELAGFARRVHRQLITMTG
jgi:hypothetical protein